MEKQQLIQNLSLCHLAIENICGGQKKQVQGPTSLMLISASTYWSPFCRMEMRAAGGTSVPLMLDWLMWLSMPKVNAEWEKPKTKHHSHSLMGECQAQNVHKHDTNIQIKVLFDPNKATNSPVYDQACQSQCWPLRAAALEAVSTNS